MAENEDQHLGVHPDILKLGVVSFLTDVSSEMIFSIFAIFFTAIAGASAALLGLVEGLADFSASSLDYVSGWLSDQTGKRKIFSLVGYGFSALTKTILLVTTSVAALGLFRVVERLGKSFRGPPRDAWLSGISSKERRGYSFGVHKALDKAGAVAGPLVAYGLLSWQGQTASAFRLLFWLAIIPAILAVLLLSWIPDRSPSDPHSGQVEPEEGILTAWKTLSASFKRYLVAAGLFSLAYFSFGFLLLRANAAGFSAADTVLLYALFNTSFVIAAPFAGKVGDRYGRARVVVLGYAIYAIMNVGFALASAKWQIIVLFILYGVFFAIDEGQNKAFISDLETNRRATAIGLYNFVTGAIYLPASLLTGVLWSVSEPLAFLTAAAISLAAIVMLLGLRPRVSPTERN